MYGFPHAPARARKKVEYTSTFLVGTVELAVSANVPLVAAAWDFSSHNAYLASLP